MDNYLFHAFEFDSSFYLYLANYKQFFRINDKEFNVLNTRGTDGKYIIDKYIELTSHIDRLPKRTARDNSYSLFLCVSNACNAMCTYCFANKGDYGKSEGLMTKDVAIRAVDFYLENTPKDSYVDLIFFGGEPLLAYDVIVATCEHISSKYGNNRVIVPRLVSNATLLTNEMIDYFADKHFTVSVSIDGGQNIHNSQRPLRNGDDSFLEATKKLDYLMQKVPVSVRGTYINFDYPLPKIYQELLELGFKTIELPPDILNFKNEDEMDKLLQQLDHLYRFVLEYIENHDDFPFRSLRDHLIRLYLPKIEAITCGAGERITAIDLKGDIYPCHRFSSEESSLCGNVFDKNVTFENDIQNKKEGCNLCWNQFTCTHGCPYNDRLYEGEGSKNPYWCMYAKKMTEIALSLVANMKRDSLYNILGLHQ